MNTKIKLSNKLEVFLAARLCEEEEKKKNGMLLEKLSRVEPSFSLNRTAFSLSISPCFVFLFSLSQLHVWLLSLTEN